MNMDLNNADGVAAIAFCLVFWGLEAALGLDTPRYKLFMSPAFLPAAIAAMIASAIYKRTVGP